MNKNTINDYYQNEMQLLNEATQDFALTHPEDAARLNVDSIYDRDPHISRLLEGAAYLNARVKQQIDLGVGHVSEALIRQLAPQHLTPYPSMTIVQFASPGQRTTKVHSLPAGVKLRSPVVGEEAAVCEFTTTQALDVLPLQLIESRLDQSGQRGASLAFEFCINEGVKKSQFFQFKLALFINSTPSQACRWHDYLLNKVRQLKLVDDEGLEHILGGKTLLKPMHLDYHDTMLPQLSRHVKAFELLRDYFLFQEKYCFVEVDMELPEDCSGRFTLFIEFSESLSDLRLHSDLFKLHCVPARNVFYSSAEPIRYQPNQSHYPLSIAHGQKKSKRLLSLEQVHAFKRQATQPFLLSDFYQMTNHQSEQGHYRLSEVLRDDDESSYTLTFSGSHEEMQISCDVLAFNGHYPRQFLQPGQLFLMDERVFALIEGSNLTRPSRYYRPILNPTYFTRVLSQVNARFDSFSDPEHLREILSMHDWSGTHEHQIKAIESIQISPFNQLRKGAVVRGLIFKLKLNDAGFSSSAEMHLFSMVLHHFIRYFSPLNTLLETRVESWPSAKAWRWMDDE